MDTCGNLSILSPSSDGAVIDTLSPSVSATPAGGTYSSSVTVTLSASEPSAIFYTADGSTPTQQSSVYTSPILLSKTTSLKYFAIDRARNESAVKTSQYIIGGSSDDYDGDGYSNTLEQQMGTDPNDPDSKPAAASIEIAPLEAPLGIEGTAQLTVSGTFIPLQGDPIQYDLSSLVDYHTDSSPVTVSNSGLVTGKSEGTAQLWAEQTAGSSSVLSNQVQVTVDGTPPSVNLLESRPYDKQGTAQDTGPTPRVPVDTGIVIRVYDTQLGDNVGIDEGTISLLVNQTEVPAKVREMIEGDLHELDIAFQNPTAFGFDQVVTVKLSLADMAGNQLVFTEVFQTETQMEHQLALLNSPVQSGVALGDGTSEISVLPEPDSIDDEMLEGARVIFHDYEPVTPRVGPVHEIPALDLATPIGIPLNLEPATVFDGPITVVLPVPDAQVQDTNQDGIPDMGLEAYDIYQFTPNPNVLWRHSADAPGWAVEESRVDHYDTLPPSIEIQINEPSPLQIGTAMPHVVPAPDIKANARDRFLVTTQATVVTVTLDLDAGAIDRSVDWWILADTPKGWYYLDLGKKLWKKGLLPSAQAAPIDMTSEIIYSGIPPFGGGTYRLYFSLDNNADGRYDGTWNDSVPVLVYR